ncbi:MAG: hypothetical protein EOP48_32070 [Sphingobacteriales bacterium]|nr:MAG: hypothetical protein EOP48_32070 [Sphingobacteriales bacterium]
MPSGLAKSIDNLIKRIALAVTLSFWLSSPFFDKFYLGYSTYPIRRLLEHNSTPHDTYTSKHRPWILKTHFSCSEHQAEAIRIERFIKKQKSRKLLEQLCNPNFIPFGHLSQLVEYRTSGINQRVVPYVRDPAAGARLTINVGLLYVLYLHSLFPFC